MTQTLSRSTAEDIDIGALWRAVASRKALLGGLVLACALATLIALQFVTPLYTSQARVLIENDEPAFMRPRNEQGSDTRVLLDPEAVASQVQVLLSRDLAFQVVKALKLDENPEFNTASGLSEALKKFMVTVGLAYAPTVSAREERALDNFERHLSVYPVAKSRVIAIDFYSRDAKTAAGVANTLAEKYLAWAQKSKMTQTKDASAWLNEQIKGLRKKVSDSEEAVEKFRSSTGLIEGSNNVTLQTQQLSELNSQLILARAQRSEAEARANLIRRMLKEKGDVGAAPDVLKSVLIQRLLEQRVRLQREMAELSATLLPSHPRIRELKSELGDLQGQIRQEAKKVVSSLENEAQIAGARETSLRASLNEMKKSSSSAREDEIKLRSLEREAKANRDLLESYLARYSEASARNDLTVPAHASIISRAHIENEPSFPLKGPITLLVAAAVGVITIAIMIARELMTGAHAGYRPVQRWRQSAPASAATPRATPSARPAPELRPSAARTIRARNARAAAKLAGARCVGPQAHSLIVAASTHHANTAQDALDVAREMAATGLRVGIVDFSTAGQNIAGLTGLSSIPGLGELLGGTAGFEDVISADPESIVQIIPPGALHGDIFADSAENWLRVQNALRQIYDCVVLHTSMSGARRLVSSMHSDEIASVLLVTGGKEEAMLADQIAEHLTSEGGASVELISYKGARTPEPVYSKPGLAGFNRKAAAAI